MRRRARLPRSCLVCFAMAGALSPQWQYIQVPRLLCRRPPAMLIRRSPFAVVQAARPGAYLLQESTASRSGARRSTQVDPSRRDRTRLRPATPHGHGQPTWRQRLREGPPATRTQPRRWLEARQRAPTRRRWRRTSWSDAAPHRSKPLRRWREAQGRPRRATTLRNGYGSGRTTQGFRRQSMPQQVLAVDPSSTLYQLDQRPIAAHYPHSLKSNQESCEQNGDYETTMAHLGGRGLRHGKSATENPASMLPSVTITEPSRLGKLAVVARTDELVVLGDNVTRAAIVAGRELVDVDLAGAPLSTPSTPSPRVERAPRPPRHVKFGVPARLQINRRELWHAAA